MLHYVSNYGSRPTYVHVVYAAKDNYVLVATRSMNGTVDPDADSQMIDALRRKVD